MGGVTAPQPVIPTAAHRPATPRRPRRWLVVLTVAWLLVLAVAAFIAARRGDATIRDQTTVEQARPHVDEAVALLAEAATADGLGVVAVAPFELVGECRVSVFRGGERYRRGLTVVVAPGTESALLERVAARLPERYDIGVRTGAAPRLVADAGYWVTLSGTVVSPGEVRFYADTGDCRVPGNVSTVDQPGADRGPVLSALGTLGLTATDWQEASVDCPGGGRTRTVQAVAPAVNGALDARLRDLPSVTPVVQTPSVYAYQLGATGVALRTRDDALIVTATTPC
jgi:hypothetical protein